MRVNAEKIRFDYGNIMNEHNLSRNVINGLIVKKSGYFRQKSKSFEAFKKLKELGYIQSEFIDEGKTA